MGVVGVNATELRVTTGVTVTVMTVEAPAVLALSVALTNIPPVTAKEPAVNVTDAPVPLTEPSALLETDHE